MMINTVNNKDGLTDSELDEYIKWEEEKYRNWKQSSQEYFKHRTKDKRIELWSPKSNQLPTSEEIASQRGWPSASDETELKRIFFSSFRSIAENKLGEANLAKVDEVLGVLYGVYLLNFITGGLIINKHFDYSSFQKWDIHQWELQTENLDPNKLDDWPIAFGLSDDRSQSTYSNIFGVSISIKVGVARYTGNNPYEQKQIALGEKDEIRKVFLGLGRKKKKVPVIQYSMSAVDEAVLTGIEEAHHSLLSHLRHVQGLDVDISSLRPTHLIEVFDRIDANSSSNDSLDYKLLYPASRRVEYAAAQCQAIYVCRYLPQTWKEGYQQFAEAIHNKRRLLKNI